MSFQTPITIAEAIGNIESNRYLLPAIQREFVWEHERIEWLFDSIMRNYPINSFLFWRVEGETKRDHKFYKFLQDYKERYNTHNEEFNTAGANDFTAILDGQQRLTALYIGLRGSYAYRMPRLKEENSERVYPTRRLYLNRIRPLEGQEDGREYEFRFLTDAEYSAENATWFKVSDIYGLSDDFEFNQFLDHHGLKESKFSYRSLSTLKNAIHSRPIINFFLEKEQEVDKALNIFIRINSGGEPLDFSDLIMSIAVANWETRDARQEINSLVDSIRDKGFNVSKDFVLKSFLYLRSGDIKFKATNFSRTNAQDFESKWDDIRDAILVAFDLAVSFGFTNKSLISKNALIPVVYYIYHRKVQKSFHSGVAHENDREVIKRWLHVSLVKRLFGGASDALLSQIRRGFTPDVLQQGVASDLVQFPTSQINNEIRRDTVVSDEFIEDLLMTQKGDKYSFSLLALLFPDRDYKNGSFHMDHLHPESKFKSLSEADTEVHGWKTYNSLRNITMLDANKNMSKQGMSLNDWVAQETQSRDKDAFLARHLIPAGISLDLANFDEFIAKRTEMLKKALKKALE